MVLLMPYAYINHQKGVFHLLAYGLSGDEKSVPVDSSCYEIKIKFDFMRTMPDAGCLESESQFHFCFMNPD